MAFALHYRQAPQHEDAVLALAAEMVASHSWRCSRENAWWR
jgi:trehalose 6-phosphate phosphatase